MCLDYTQLIYCIIKFSANNDPTSKATDDEPFAWEAREYLRKKLVGKKVFFKTAGQVSGGGKTQRYYGDIFYPTLGKIINEFSTQMYITTVRNAIFDYQMGIKWL